MPVILLHGITNSGRAWLQQLPMLVQAGFKVIIPDHAGHGSSDPIDHVYGVEFIANDTLALMTHLGLQKAHIVGLSLGGMVALQIATNDPERVDRLIIANSFGTFSTPVFCQLAASWKAHFLQIDGPLSRFDSSWPMLVTSAFRSTSIGIQFQQIFRAQAATASGQSLAFLCDGIVEFDVRSRLYSLRRKTMIMSGEQDLMSKPEIGEELARMIPDAIYTKLKNSAHLSNVDSAESFNREMHQFLTE